MNYGGSFEGFGKQAKGFGNRQVSHQARPAPRATRRRVPARPIGELMNYTGLKLTESFEACRLTERGC
jgi:hypothetical protein